MTHYERLGIDPGASTEEVERAFRKVARQVHPDLNSGDPAVAEERMKQLNESRDILSDPSLRAAYDETLREPPPRAAPPPPPPPPKRRPWIVLGVAASGALAAALLLVPGALPSTNAPVEPSATGAEAPLLAVPTTKHATETPAPTRPARGKVHRRGAVKLGSTADDVFAAFGPPDRIQPGAHPGDATLHYGPLTLEMKNGRVTGGDAAR